MRFPLHSFKLPVWVLGGLVVLVVAAGAQQVPTISVNVNVVNVLATVRDKHGKIINNLSQDDFVLEEEGRAQAVRYFSRETDLPLTLGLLVDTSVSQRQVLEQERSASGGFVEQVLREDKDKAFLIHFDREVELLQDLTSSKQKLQSALGSMQMPQLKRQRDDSDSGAEGTPGNRGGRRGSAGRSLGSGGGTTLYDAIYLASSELMQKQQGRKAVVVLSDGVDRGSKMTLDRAIESAQRADTVVYSILFAGQESHANDGGWGHGGRGSGGEIGGPLGRPGGYPRYPQPQSRPQPPPDRPDGKKILERVSKETGGRMFEVSKKQTVEQIYRQIQEELRNQYSLGYSPDRPGSAAEYRRIHLTTTKKELVVQARDGYYPTTLPDSLKGQEQK
jgi:VWFA-related protein